MAMSRVEILRERLGDVTLVTLCNPDKRNALDPQVLEGLVLAVEEAENEGARALVLTGAGDACFSAGYDIAALPVAPDYDWLRDHGPLGGALRALSRIPVVAALNGPAIGSGFELALTADLRVAHPEVTLRMPPVRMGIIYTPEGVARLVSICGDAIAREMLLCARTVTAQEALGMGLVNRVVSRNEVLPLALSLAQEIAKGAPLAVRGTKALLERLLCRGPQLPIEDAALILEERRKAWYSEDAKEARLAFLERRQPTFVGR